MTFTVCLNMLYFLYEYIDMYIYNISISSSDKIIFLTIHKVDSQSFVVYSSIVGRI